MEQGRGGPGVKDKIGEKRLVKEREKTEKERKDNLSREKRKEKRDLSRLDPVGCSMVTRLLRTCSTSHEKDFFFYSHRHTHTHPL
jgi:hypothetical protein